MCFAKYATKRTKRTKRASERANERKKCIKYILPLLLQWTKQPSERVSEQTRTENCVWWFMFVFTCSVLNVKNEREKEKYTHTTSTSTFTVFISAEFDQTHIGVYVFIDLLTGHTHKRTKQRKCADGYDLKCTSYFSVYSFDLLCMWTCMLCGVCVYDINIGFWRAKRSFSPISWFHSIFFI